MTGVFPRGEETEIKREEAKMEAEIEVTLSQAKEYQGLLLEASTNLPCLRKGKKGFLPRPFGGSMAL